MSKRLVAVSGATGQQGGAVVEALLRLGGFKVRGLTRDPSSAAAKELGAKGVEVGNFVNLGLIATLKLQTIGAQNSSPGLQKQAPYLLG